ncbi:MAG: DUF5522 domain-containing protein [Planctomycetota bacterium]
MQGSHQRSHATAKPDAAEPDYYVENGCVVFTAAYHRRRGYCCGNLCRHCPYEGEAKRTEPIAADNRRRA